MSKPHRSAEPESDERIAHLAEALRFLGWEAQRAGLRELAAKIHDALRIALTLSRSEILK